MSKEIVSALSAKFQPEQVHKRVGSSNPNTGEKVYYDYVKIEDILERIGEVFGAQISCRVTDEKTVLNNRGKECVRVAVELSYYDNDSGRQYFSVGFGSSKGITDNPGSDAQSALSTAIKRAAKFWGLKVDGGLDEEDDRSVPDSAITSSPTKPSASPPKPVGSAPAPKPITNGAPKPAPVPVLAPKPSKPAAKEDSAELPSEYDLNAPSDETYCNDCSLEITPSVSSDNEELSVEFIIETALNLYDVPLCASCVRTRLKKV